MKVLLIAIGASLGAPARYLTDIFVQARHDSVFPWGTFAVNVVGSFILGMLTAASRHIDPAVAAGLGIGFCGALTTYSTFGYETLRLVMGGTRFLAVANVVASVLAGLGAAGVGFAVGGALA